MIIITKKLFHKLPQVLTKFTFNFVAFLILIFSTQAMSYQQVSQAQIAAFQKMSPTQQKALAKSMGIDISGIGDISKISKQMSGTGIESKPIVNT